MIDRIYYRSFVAVSLVRAKKLRLSCLAIYVSRRILLLRLLQQIETESRLVRHC